MILGFNVQFSCQCEHALGPNAVAERGKRAHSLMMLQRFMNLVITLFSHTLICKQLMGNIISMWVPL